MTVPLSPPIGATRPARPTGAVVSLSIVLAFAVAAVAAPLIPTAGISGRVVPPAWATGGDPRFPLGTDLAGTDMVVSTLLALGGTLTAALAALLPVTVLGLALGLAAGLGGSGRAGRTIDGIAETLGAPPALMIAFLAAGIGRTLSGDDATAPVAIAAIGLGLLPLFVTRACRAMQTERRQSYARAAAMLGLSRMRAELTHVLPNAARPLLAATMNGFATAILLETTLSFLAIGLPPDWPSLGTLIRSGYVGLETGAWWIVAFPGAALATLLVAAGTAGRAPRGVADSPPG